MYQGKLDKAPVGREPRAKPRAKLRAKLKARLKAKPKAREDRPLQPSRCPPARSRVMY